LRSTDRYVLEGIRASFYGRDVVVADVSVGGLFVATSRPPLPGTALTLALVIDDRQPFEVGGSVIWVNLPDERKTDRLPEGFGFQIRKIALVDKLAIVSRLRLAEASGESLARPPLSH
jgi:Tfp pilus assembly protein PilZ